MPPARDHHHPSLDPRKLLYFLTAVDCGSYARAARELEVSQSTLSEHVLSLEKQLGRTLLTRGPHGVIVTEAGKILYRHAQVIVRQVRPGRAGREAGFRRCLRSGVAWTRNLWRGRHAGAADPASRDGAVPRCAAAHQRQLRRHAERVGHQRPHRPGDRVWRRPDQGRAAAQPVRRGAVPVCRGIGRHPRRSGRFGRIWRISLACGCWCRVRSTFCAH